MSTVTTCDVCGRKDSDRHGLEMQSWGSLHQRHYYDGPRYWDLCSVCFDALVDKLRELQPHD